VLISDVPTHTHAKNITHTQHLITAVTYIGTSKMRWIYWTSPHWENHINMLSKLSRNFSSKIRENSSLQISNNRIMEKVYLNHKKGAYQGRKTSIQLDEFVITLNCTTHAYLASGQLISLLCQKLLNNSSKNSIFKSTR
jgi:hypothetical protein